MLYWRLYTYSIGAVVVSFFLISTHSEQPSPIFCLLAWSAAIGLVFSLMPSSYSFWEPNPWFLGAFLAVFGMSSGGVSSSGAVAADCG
jgi:hypothetical protein